MVYARNAFLVLLGILAIDIYNTVLENSKDQARLLYHIEVVLNYARACCITAIVIFSVLKM